MKKFFDEIVILILQLIIFYVFPLFATHEDTSGMLVIVLLATFMSALAMGGVSKKRIKYYYPIIIVIFFIPAIFIYNKEFQVVHSLWCLLDAFIGVLIGKVIMKK